MYVLLKVCTSSSETNIHHLILPWWGEASVRIVNFNIVLHQEVLSCSVLTRSCFVWYFYQTERWQRGKSLISWFSKQLTRETERWSFSWDPPQKNLIVWSRHCQAFPELSLASSQLRTRTPHPPAGIDNLIGISSLFFPSQVETVQWEAVVCWSV